MPRSAPRGRVSVGQHPAIRRVWVFPVRAAITSSARSRKVPGGCGTSSYRILRRVPHRARGCPSRSRSDDDDFDVGGDVLAPVPRERWNAFPPRELASSGVHVLIRATHVESLMPSAWRQESPSRFRRRRSDALEWVARHVRYHDREDTKTRRTDRTITTSVTPLTAS